MSDITIPVGAGTSALDVTPSDVSDELDRAGAAFGDLVRLTGKAVADTQQRLNKTAAASISALAKTLVDVIAVNETVYDDAGTVTESITHTQKLPLITFIDPVVYEWRQVRLQGRFVAEELSTRYSSSSRRSSYRTGSSQSGLLVWLGGGQTYNRLDIAETSMEVTGSRDASTGTVRMNAQLQPRTDVGVPKPRQAVQAPRIAILEGEIVDDAATSSRTMTIVVEFFRRDGTPIEGKGLSIETDGVPWSYDGPSDTDTDGRVTIVLRRDFSDPEVDRSPIDVVVSARKGMVATSSTVTF
jgi:vacuolar-type H+-ATPase subunit F/Vma7